MLLSEITASDLLSKRRSDMFPYSWVAVPKGTLWLSAINGLWIVKTFQEAQSALESPAIKFLHRTASVSYPVSVKAFSGTNAVVFVRGNETNDAFEWPQQFLGKRTLPILAIGLSEKGARAAGEKALATLGLKQDLWVFKSPNLDPVIFDYTEDQLRRKQPITEGRGQQVLQFADYISKIGDISTGAQEQYKKVGALLFKSGFKFEPQFSTFEKSIGEAVFNFDFPDDEEKHLLNGSLILTSCAVRSGTLTHRHNKFINAEFIVDVGIDAYLEILEAKAKAS